MACFSESGNGFITSLGSITPVASELVLEVPVSLEGVVPESAAAAPEEEFATGVDAVSGAPDADL